MPSTFLPDALVLATILSAVGAVLCAGELILRALDRKNRLARWIERLGNK